MKAKSLAAIALVILIALVIGCGSPAAPTTAPSNQGQTPQGQAPQGE